jgi:hypothetical protein
LVDFVVGASRTAVAIGFILGVETPLLYLSVVCCSLQNTMREKHHLCASKPDKAAQIRAEEHTYAVAA